MKIKQLKVLALSWALLALAPAAISATDANTLDAKTLGQAAGTEASVTDDDVTRIGWSRTDVPAKVDGLEFPSPAGLGVGQRSKPCPRVALWSWAIPLYSKTKLRRQWTRPSPMA
jgi:hypothetical protein